MAANRKVVVLGAGIGGLAAAYYLSLRDGFEITVIEKEAIPGGVCGSFSHAGFTLDYGPHKLYSVLPGIMDDIREILGNRALEVEKKNRLFLNGHPVDYPLKPGNLLKALGVGESFKIGLGFGLSLLQGLVASREASTYEQYMIRRFGRRGYELIFKPLAEKVWGDPSHLHADVAAIRVPASGGLEVLLKLLKLKQENARTNAGFFLYPEQGFGAFAQAMVEAIEDKGGKVLLGTKAEKIQLEDGNIRGVQVAADGRADTIGCDLLINSIRPSEVGAMIWGRDSEQAVFVRENLRLRDAMLVYLGIDRDRVLEDQWIFFPERSFPFSRLSEPKLISYRLGPVGKTVLCCDFTCEEGCPQWQGAEDDLIRTCIRSLVNAGFITEEEVEYSFVKRIPRVYPVYDCQYRDNLSRLYSFFDEIGNLILTGRSGMFNYNNADHCLDMGKLIAQRLFMGEPLDLIRSRLQERAGNYKIVD